MCYKYEKWAKKDAAGEGEARERENGEKWERNLKITILRINLSK